jgi:hypothetical protein
MADDEFEDVYPIKYDPMDWKDIAQMAAEENKKTGHVSRFTAKAFMLRSIDHALTQLDEYVESPDWPWMEAQHSDLREIFIRAVDAAQALFDDAYGEIMHKS